MFTVGPVFAQSKVGLAKVRRKIKTKVTIQRKSQIVNIK